ncbi:MAG TPA: diguanylate cyclase [Solirubrobacteraceae bacterium]|jgi:diguanylate cyclase (GGDEF)-like protein|nr:diguanylate cyclase [Solirubrobacteraceae bacterium]
MSLVLAAGRSRSTIVAAGALIALTATLALGIVLSQRQSREQIVSSFGLRGTSSAALAAAIAMPYQTASGRRASSAAYPTSGSSLGAVVDHTISYRQHNVYLVDPAGRLLAASPKTQARTLSVADPALARSLGHASSGNVDGAPVPSSFTSAPVPGTSWRLVVAVPDSRLFASIDGWTAVIPWLVLGLVSVLGLGVVALFARVTALSRRMGETARTDELTGLSNRRAVSEQLARAAAHARRRGEPLSVLMIDLDRFKETNDRYGHAAGDRVLRAVAECMRGALRAEDLCGRWGGDEFVVLMPCADEQDAQVVAERLAQVAREVDLSDIGLEQGVPMSIGLASASLTSAEEIVQAADLALYEAKASRRAERALGAAH